MTNKIHNTGKYAPLSDHLKDLEDNNVGLSFEQIETIIRARLPASAKLYREWWSNQTNFTNRPQAKAWMKEGFRVKTVHQSSQGGWVEFERT